MVRELKQNEAASSRPKRKRPKRRPWWWRLIRVLLLAYLIIVILMAYRENQMVYPGAYFSDKPPAKQAAAPFESFQYPSPGGSELTGYVLKRGTSADWVVFYHGNATRADQMFGWMERLADAFNANVAAIEYRGYTDDHQPSESKVIRDAISGTRTLIEKHSITPENLVLYGRSLGGAIAAGVAVDTQPSTLILERTFDSAVRVASHYYPWLPVPWIMKNRFDTSARLTQFSGDLIVVHGPDDEVVPFQAGKRLFDNAGTSDKHWIEPASLGHLDPVPDSLLEEIATAAKQLRQTPP
ncbi:MAG: alpha/beta hydrolase [Planctomycetota bacterium]